MGYSKIIGWWKNIGNLIFHMNLRIKEPERERERERERESKCVH